MFRLFTPIILLQCFCVYHAYKNNKDRIWYFIIILLPIVGCLIYIFDNFNSPDNIGDIAENFKSAVNTNHRVKKLEKAIQFSDNIINKTALADEYVKLKRYAEAIDLYESCLEGYNADDEEILLKLLKAEYHNENYQRAVEYGQRLQGKHLFKSAEEEQYLALALYNNGDVHQAFTTFQRIDVPFGNYDQRLTYYGLLVENDSDKAKEKLKEILDEFNHMDGLERRNNEATFGKLKKLYQSLPD